MKLWENKMLPEEHHPGDEKWLTEKFDELIAITGINHARVVAEKYSIAYANEYEITQEGHKKDGRARYCANSRLVKLMKSLGAAPVQPNA